MGMGSFASQFCSPSEEQKPMKQASHVALLTIVLHLRMTTMQMDLIVHYYTRSTAHLPMAKRSNEAITGSVLLIVG